MLKRLSLFSLLLLFITLSVFLSKTYAVLGVGDIVHDPAAFMLQQEQYLEDIRGALYQILTWENSVQQLYYSIQNLKSLDPKLSAKNLTSILHSIDSLESVIYGVRGIGFTYQNMQRQFDQLYPSFQKVSKMSGRDYAKESQKILEQTNYALSDAMKAQGLISQIPDDKRLIENLLNNSQDAEGVLTVLQINNQLLATLAEQLMRLETIIATSYRAQASFLAQQTTESALAVNRKDNTIQSDNTLNSSGNGTGIVKFK